MNRFFIVCIAIQSLFLSSPLYPYDYQNQRKIIQAIMEEDAEKEREFSTRTPKNPEKRLPWVCVSLGWNCEVALQLNQHNIRTFSFPFDWNQTPIHSLLAILRNRFTNFVNPDYLVSSPIGWCGVLNTQYNFTLSHDFPAKPNGELVDNFLELAPSINEKYQRRISRFFDVCNMADFVYFFRMGSHEWRHDIHQGKHEVTQLRDLLLDLFPQKNWLLVVAHYTPDYQHDWQMPMVKNYDLSKKGWGSLFRQLGLVA